MKHITPLCTILGLCVLPIAVFAILPASDSFNFNSAAETLTSWNPSWTYAGTSLFSVGTIGGSVGACWSAAGNVIQLARWNADTFNNDQFAQAVIETLGSGSYAGVSVRLNTAGTMTGYYVLFSNNNDLSLRKMLAGSETVISTLTRTNAVGETIRLEVSGTTLSVKVNGSVVIGPTTDSSITGGSAGIGGYGNDGGTTMVNWQGGNLTAGTAAVLRHAVIMQ